MAIIVPEIFSDVVNAKMGVALRVGRFATDYTDMVEEITQYGDEVNFPEIDRIGDATTMEKGTPINPNAVNMTENKATIRHIGNGVRIFDKDLIQVKGNLKDRLAEQLGDSMAKAIDADLVASILNEAVYKDEVIESNFNEYVIESAFDVFGDAQDDDVFAGILINSRLRKHFKNMKPFTDMNVSYVVNGNGAVKDGIIGYWNGSIPVIMSNNGTYDSGTKKAIFAIVKKNALGYIIQRQCNVEEEREAKLKATDIVADELYATKLLHKDGVSVITVKLPDVME